jgi:hypothetical protein
MKAYVTLWVIPDGGEPAMAALENVHKALSIQDVRVVRS